MSLTGSPGKGKSPILLNALDELCPLSYEVPLSYTFSAPFKQKIKNKTDKD